MNDFPPVVSDLPSATMISSIWSPVVENGKNNLRQKHPLTTHSTTRPAASAALLIGRLRQTRPNRMHSVLLRSSGRLEVVQKILIHACLCTGLALKLISPGFSWTQWPV